METKEFDLKGFSGIEIGGAFKADIVRSDSFRVTVTADDFTHIRVEKADNSLIIRRQGIQWFAPIRSRPTATVTLPILTELDISGASDVKLENFQSDNNLTITLSGASHIEANDISAGRIEANVIGASTLNGSIKAAKDALFDLSGASKMDLKGTGTGMTLKVSGASKAELSQFPVQNAGLNISGASSAFVNLDGRLDADVSGASKLYWSGSPTMGDIKTSGASNIRQK